MELDGTRWVSAGPQPRHVSGRARRLVMPGGENLALVRDGDAISALHGVCAHQGGPLAEGRVRDGCLTCPWHGWEYRAADGQSPPPFTEKLPTHRVRLDGRGHLLVDVAAQPPGTPCEPVRLASGGTPAPDTGRDDFFVGYLPMSGPATRFSLASAGAIAGAVLVAGLVLAAFERSPGADLRPGVYGARHAGLLFQLPYPHLRTLGCRRRRDDAALHGLDEEQPGRAGRQGGAGRGRERQRLRTGRPPHVRGRRRLRRRH